MLQPRRRAIRPRETIFLSFGMHSLYLSRIAALANILLPFGIMQVYGLGASALQLPINPKITPCNWRKLSIGMMMAFDHQSTPSFLFFFLGGCLHKRLWSNGIFLWLIFKLLFFFSVTTLFNRIIKLGLWRESNLGNIFAAQNTTKTVLKRNSIFFLTTQRFRLPLAPTLWCKLSYVGCILGRRSSSAVIMLSTKYLFNSSQRSDSVYYSWCIQLSRWRCLQGLSGKFN